MSGQPAVATVMLVASHELTRRLAEAVAGISLENVRNHEKQKKGNEAPIEHERIGDRRVEKLCRVG